mmetsp:Transcript_99238/g.206785  ORF Transcript_99238/g.206785 Transcript_99238/m.206785 type:complete len:97 (+) Transcript_99238:17-307(+)
MYDDAQLGCGSTLSCPIQDAALSLVAVGFSWLRPIPSNSSKQLSEPPQHILADLPLFHKACTDFGSGAGDFPLSFSCFCFFFTVFLPHPHPPRHQK